MEGPESEIRGGSKHKTAEWLLCETEERSKRRGIKKRTGKCQTGRGGDPEWERGGEEQGDYIEKDVMVKGGEG